MKINLLPPEMKHNATKENRLRLMVATVLLVVLLSVFLTYRLHLSVQKLAQSELVLKDRIAQLAPLEALLAERALLEKRVAELEEAGIGTAPFLPTLYLAELVTLLPARTILSDVTLARDSLRFSGVVGSLAEAADLLQLFQNSPLYKNPVLLYLTSEEQGYRFEVAATLVGGEE